MKKLFTIFLLFAFLSGFSQEVKPTGTNFKTLQSPSFGYNTADSIPWMYKSSVYGWNSLATIKRLNHSLDSLKRTISGGATPIDDILHWSTNKYTPFSAKKTTDPGYAYFYNSSEIPSFVGNILNIDGTVRSPSFVSSSLDENQFSGMTESSFFNGSFIGSDAHISEMGSGQTTHRLQRAGGIIDYLSFGFPTSGINLNKAVIASNRNLITPMPLIIDASDLTIAQGTANKWLSLDSNKKIVYNDAPSGGSVLASNGLHLDSDTVKMGGVIRENTDISIGGNSFDIHNSGLDFLMNGDALKLSSGYINADPYQGYLDIDAGEASITASSNNSDVGIIAYSDYAAGLTYHSVSSGDNYNSNLYLQQDTAKLQVEKNDKYFLRLSNHEIETSIFHRYYYGLSIHNYSGTIADSTGIRYTRIPESSFQDSTLVTKHYISKKIIAGSVSVSTTSTSSLTVIIGQIMDNTTYKVCVTPTSSIAAVPFYVTSKSTTQFSVTYLTPSTGYVSFDWILTP